MVKESVTHCTLVGVSRMGQISDDEGFDGHETAKFNTGSHLNYFGTVFEFYNIDFDE